MSLCYDELVTFWILKPAYIDKDYYSKVWGL